MQKPRWVPPALLRITGWRGRFTGLALGAVAVLGLAPFHIWPLMMVSLAFLLARLILAGEEERATKAGVSVAFWHALGYFLAGTYWIGSAFIARGPEFIPIMPPMILALGALLAFFWGLAGGLFARLRPQGIIALPLFFSLFFLAEFTRGHLFGGFPWNLPGYIFEAGGPVSQFASIGGIYGLSAFVFVLSALLYGGLFRRQKLAYFAAFLVLFGGVFTVGYLRLANAKVEYVEGVKLRIAHIRFEQKDKLDPQASVNIVNAFITQSLAPGIEDVTHLIWPEGAVTGLAIENEPLMSAMGYELSQVDVTPPIWLLNSLRHEQRPDPRTGATIDDYYNSSVAVRFSARGVPSIAALNDKRRLVPFGEFIPGGKWMEARNVPVISTSLLSISAAKIKTLATFPGLPKVSPQICYEIIFSGLTPRPKNEPSAEWILNQSNDAWYGDSIGPMQHANMSRFRAIEEGLPVIRAASNGVSAIIDSYGRYKDSVTPKKSEFVDGKLPKKIQSPPFKRFFNYLLALINLLIALCCLTVLLMGSDNHRNF